MHNESLELNRGLAQFLKSGVIWSSVAQLLLKVNAAGLISSQLQRLGGEGGGLRHLAAHTKEWNGIEKLSVPGKLLSNQKIHMISIISLKSLCRNSYQHICTRSVPCIHHDLTYNYHIVSMNSASAFSR